MIISSATWKDVLTKACKKGIEEGLLDMTNFAPFELGEDIRVSIFQSMRHEFQVITESPTGRQRYFIIKITEK